MRLHKEQEAKRQVKGKAPEDDIELQSIWPQLTKVLKWLVENIDEEAVDVLHFIKREHENFKEKIQKLTSQMY